MATEEEDLKTSLRKELGIGSDVSDESPHRFYDWGHDDDGKGAADPSNFLTIEDQIRQRAERLKLSEIAEKEEEVRRK